jgi:hypothetical protein
MKILDKIDEQIDKIENRLDRVLEGKRKVGGKEYDEFFTKMLKKWKIKSYKDLPKDKQDDFFNEVDRKWNSKKEKGKDGKR